MPEAPRLSGRQAVRVFEMLGFTIVRQRGSHVVLRRGDRGCVVPLHKELAVGTLRSALKQAGITIEIFTEAMKKK
jgi:predicted RNA binding protein YcfA (HicA-like mRNA interferase family)